MAEEKPLQDDESAVHKPADRRRTTSASHIPTDLSDTTESDGEKQTK